MAPAAPLSHVDRVNLRTWSAAVWACAATFVNLLVFTVAAHFPDVGFPCYYPHVVDFDNLNLSVFNAIHHLTPQLYLDPTQLVLYVYGTELVFLAVLSYYLYCWARVTCGRGADAWGGVGGAQVNQSTRDIAFVGDSTSCFAFVLTMDTFQAFLLTLSFRLPGMIAFAKSLYFICLTAFVVTLVTNPASRERAAAFSLSKLHPSLRGSVAYRTAVVNLTELALGLATMVLALSLSLGFGNNFFVKTVHMVFAALGLFGALAAAYFVVLETVLIRYAKVQFGYHAGALLGACGALFPVLRYEALNASEYARGIHLGLAAVFGICAVFAVTRAVRFALRRAGRRSYRPLAATGDEIRALRGETD